jgi:D-alanyl-D-alanine carboxypeptidase/D-alanyl-D-alanine-endopeptidase (penicillin-binding protein 4)
MVGAIALMPSARALCPEEFATEVEQLVNRPELAQGRVGIWVETWSGEVIMSRDGDRFFVPASTLKLVTTAAALAELGPNYTVQTLVSGATNVEGRTTLQVIGAGDPSFDRVGLEQLSQQLRAQGIDHIDRLYGNESTFWGEAVNPNWEWEDVQAGYGAPVNALILNRNAIDLSLSPQTVGAPLRVVWANPQQATDWTIENFSTTVAPSTPEFLRIGRTFGRPVLSVWGQLIEGTDSETISIAEPHPGQAFLDAWQTVLLEYGITVQQSQVGLPANTVSWQELASVTSPPVAELLMSTNQDSTNLYAEALLKILGTQRPTADDATQAGIAVVRQVLHGWNIDLDTLVMVDGSGLARKNLITPQTMVKVLQAMTTSPHARAYQDSLAIAGTSGTLRNRLQDTPVEGRLYGKTGAISRNFALAGYFDPQGDWPLTFSIFLNNVDVRGAIARRMIDEIVLLIAQLEDCHPTTMPH